MNTLLTILLQAPTEAHLLFRSDKIYTVLGVMLIIWTGVLLMMIRQQRKLSKLEREIKEFSDEQANLTETETN